MSVLFSNTNLGDNTLAVKPILSKFYSFFSTIHAELRFEGGVARPVIIEINTNALSGRGG
jgi:hypothetical protein